MISVWLEKTQSGKSRDYRDVIVFKMFFGARGNEMRAFSNALSLKSVFAEDPFSFRISVDGRPNSDVQSNDEETQYFFTGGVV